MNRSLGDAGRGEAPEGLRPPLAAASESCLPLGEAPEGLRPPLAAASESCPPLGEAPEDLRPPLAAANESCLPIGEVPEDLRPPLAESNVTVVAVAVVRRGNDVLVGRRGDDGPLPGLAEFPGGKCLPGELPEACVLRECREETGLEVSVRNRLDEVEHTYPHGRLRIIFFLCEPIEDAQPRPPFRWVPVPELPSLPFPEANAPVILCLATSSAW